MPVQDLTPQLRTRLSRVERAVGWFVILATLLLLTGFGYYVYHTAERKGWFKTKASYYIYLKSGAGLNQGDPVKLMGFNVGQITDITAMPPYSGEGDVFVQFIVLQPFFGYIWDDSVAQVTTADLLGKRTVEVTRGGLSTNKNLHATYQIDKKYNITGIWLTNTQKYVPIPPNSNGYGLPSAESPALGERLESVANQVESALPNILALTNQIVALLTNATHATVQANSTLVRAEPILSNAAIITGFLTNGKGSLGEWLLPTNVNHELQQTLASADLTLRSANTNVTRMADTVTLTLGNLANMTSNLNAQVQSNDQMLSQISTTVIHADQFVQGLKHHWLLRSAFKGQPSTPATLQAPPPAPKLAPPTSSAAPAPSTATPGGTVRAAPGTPVPRVSTNPTAQSVPTPPPTSRWLTPANPKIGKRQ